MTGDRSTRRDFLRASGVAGVLGLTGCLRFATGGGNSTATEPDASDRDDASDGDGAGDDADGDGASGDGAGGETPTEAPSGTPTGTEARTERQEETERETDTQAATPTASSGELTELWSSETDGVVRDYMLTGDRLYAVTDKGRLRTLGTATGEKQASTSFDDAVHFYGLATDGTHVAVALENNRLKILDAGSLSVQQTIPFSGDFAGLVAQNGTAVLSTTTGVEGFALSNGNVKWRKDTTGKSPLWTIPEGVVGHIGGKFPLLSVETGEEIWKTDINDGYGYLLPESWTDHTKYWGVTVLGDYLVTSTVGGGYNVVDKNSGEKQWSARGNGHAIRPAVSENRIVTQVNESIVSRKPDSGDEEWRTSLTPHANAMTIHGGELVVFGQWKSKDENAIVGLDPASRAINWERPADDPFGMLTVRGDTVYGLNLNTSELRAYEH